VGVVAVYAEDLTKHQRKFGEVFAPPGQLAPSRPPAPGGKLSEVNASAAVARV
jgi:hypothetical protein